MSPMILVTADDETGPAVVAELARRGVEARASAIDLTDPRAATETLRGVDRLYLADRDAARAVDVLSVAEQLGVYHVVTAIEEHTVVEHLQQSSLRWTLLQGGATSEPGAVAALAARALAEEGHENSYLPVDQRANFRDG